MSDTKRPSKIDYYLNIARQVMERSNCRSVKIGAIIVRDDQIVSTGYNGAPRKTRDCLDHGSCLRRNMNVPSGERYELCRTVHAEQNAIINAARSGVSVLNGTMYMYGVRVFEVDEPKPIDSLPCFICKKMVINAGIQHVVAHMEDGKVKDFDVSAWVDDWAENDMTSDIMKYETKYEKKSKSKN